MFYSECHFNSYIVVMLHRHHHRNRQHRQTSRITYKTIIIRQIEQFLIAASLFELIFDSYHDEFEYSWRLEFENPDAGHEYLAPLGMVEFCETISPVLPSIRYLVSRDQFLLLYKPDTTAVTTARSSLGSTTDSQIDHD